MRRDRRNQYMRDRAERRMQRRDRTYGGMDYGYDYAESRGRYDSARGRDRQYRQDHNMEYQQPRESMGMYYDDMMDSRRGSDYRGDYRGSDYAIRGIGRPREYNRRDRRDYRDYAEDEEYDEEYHEDLKKWTEKLKRYDRFNMPKEQLMASAKQMGVRFDDYDEDEFYAVYLMQVSDYPTISNEPHVYLGMAKSWLEDKDIKIEPSEKLCKYMYEIAMAEE